MFVKQYMTKDPVTIGPEVLILDALQLLRQHNFRHLPVTDRHGILQGIVTDRDLRSALPSSIATQEERENIMARVKDTPVSKIMSRALNTLRMESTLDDALILLMQSNVGAIPVVDRDMTIMGIFSIRDLMRAYGSLFGLGEKGSYLVTVRAAADDNLIARVVSLLAENNVVITRIIQEGGSSTSVLHIRVNTINIRAVHAVLEKAGMEIVTP